MKDLINKYIRYEHNLVLIIALVLNIIVWLTLSNYWVKVAHTILSMVIYLMYLINRKKKLQKILKELEDETK